MKFELGGGDGGSPAKWARVSLRARGVAALAVPMLALFAALLSIYSVEDSAAVADQTVVSAYETRAGLLQFYIYLLDADSAVSDYLATGDGRFFSGYDSAKLEMEQTLARLSTLVADDPASVTALEEIKSSAANAMGILSQARMAAAADARAILLKQAGAFVADVQARQGAMNQAQDLRLFRAQYNRDAARQRLFRVVLVCGIVGPLGALFVHLLLTGRLVKRLRAVGENARRLALGLPLEPIKHGTDEVAELARQLEYAALLLREREARLQESERRHRDLFDHAPIPYEETDAEGVVRRLNQAAYALLRCSPERMMGSRAWDFADPAQRDELRDAMMARIAAGKESGPFECDYLLDDGSRLTVEIHENLLRDELGKVTGICRSLLDVTERNLAAVAARKVEQYAGELRHKNEQLGRALEAARTATAAKSRFLAGFSHELRTPLNGIIGLSELVHDGKLGPITEDQRDCLADVLSSARHLLELINNILDLSKVDAGKMEFRPAPSNIEALVGEVRDALRPLAAKKNIGLITEVPAAFSAVTDPSRFKQILYNYLSNAVKFTGEGGQVVTRVTPQGDALFRLEVEDSGIGIEPEEIPRLFQEFQQISSSRKAEQGTGLGLALTRHIVEAQGGAVAVRSIPGQGSVFSAVLPIEPAKGV